MWWSRVRRRLAFAPHASGVVAVTEKPSERQAGMTTDGEVTDETTDAERREAHVPPGNGPTPTPEEEAAAERGRESTSANRDDVAEHYEEMIDLGANVKGEGEVN